MPFSLKLVKPETLRVQVENHLREAIVSGQLKSGEKLIERELCEMLGVSRPSLREALRRLEAEKLIVIVAHRGPEVAVMSMAEARDLYALRRLLESYLSLLRSTLLMLLDRLPRSVEEIEALQKCIEKRDALGAGYVDNSIKHADDFNRPMQDLVTEYCWNEVWNRPGLDRRTRSIINLSMLTALNRPHELKLHVRGAFKEMGI